MDMGLIRNVDEIIKVDMNMRLIWNTDEIKEVGYGGVQNFARLFSAATFSLNFVSPLLRYIL